MLGLRVKNAKHFPPSELQADWCSSKKIPAGLRLRGELPMQDLVCQDWVICTLFLQKAKNCIVFLAESLCTDMGNNDTGILQLSARRVELQCFPASDETAWFSNNCCTYRNEDNVFGECRTKGSAAGSQSLNVGHGLAAR